MKKKRKRITVMLPTDDNWYGNFPDNQVEVTLTTDLLIWGNGRGSVVSVWGNDDTGLDKIFTGPYGKTEARATYRILLKRGRVNQKDLLVMGFGWA